MFYHGPADHKILSPTCGYNGEYDAVNKQFHWCLRSGMTHISGSVPFASQEDFDAAIETGKPMDSKRILDLFRRLRAFGFNYVVDSAMCNVEDALQMKYDAAKVAEHGTRDDKAALYVLFRVFPEMVEADVADRKADAAAATFS